MKQNTIIYLVDCPRERKFKKFEDALIYALTSLDNYRIYICVNENKLYYITISNIKEVLK